MTVNTILCRYGELALKGNNRRRFERQLLKQIRRSLTAFGELSIIRERGRIILERADREALTEAQLAHVRERLPEVFGLVSFSPAVRVKSLQQPIEEAATTLFPQAYEALAGGLREGMPITFRVRVRRADKTFPMRSVELSKHLADLIIPNYPRLQVDLSDAAMLTLSAEVRERVSFVYCETCACAGGLPADSAENALALLSGGIDSPVACYLAMKRGVHLDFLTFHSHPYTTLESVHKVARLVRRLNEFQRPGRYFACNMAEAQKIFRDQCTESYRTIFYRRLMMRIATAMGPKLRTQAIVTGECIGQVASQTVPNLTAINEAAGQLVVRPLIAMDKQDAVDMARRIGTFDISAEQCADSCTVFAPSQPATGVKLFRVHNDEAELDLDAMVEQCLEATVQIDPESLEEQPWDG